MWAPIVAIIWVDDSKPANTLENGQCVSVVTSSNLVVESWDLYMISSSTQFYNCKSYMKPISHLRKASITYNSTIFGSYVPYHT